MLTTLIDPKFGFAANAFCMLDVDNEDNTMPSWVMDNVSCVGTAIMKDDVPANRIEVAVKFDPFALDAVVGDKTTSTKFSNIIV